VTTVNVTIAGFGFMGTMHAQIYTQLPGARLIGVADPRTDVTRAKLQSLGLDVPVFNSLPELLSALPETRMVDVCTPLDAHEADALTALKSGRHLFCEKPLAPGLAAADRIIAAANRAGVMAQVGHCIRFWPEYMALREFVRDNRGGKLLSLSLTRQPSRPEYTVGNWANCEQRSGGAALDLHIHDTDFAIALLGMSRAVYSRSVAHLHPLRLSRRCRFLRGRMELSAKMGISNGISSDLREGMRRLRFRQVTHSVRDLE
jgi:predicted dehydrogenase